MSSSEQTLEMGASNFALKLTQQLHNPGHNLVVSPFSLSYALAMLSAGAQGATREQLLTTMFYNGQTAPADTANVEKVFATTCQAFVDSNKDVMSNTNMLYSQIGYPLKATFQDTLKKTFKAVAKLLDFDKASQQAVDTINADVKEATKGLIEKILDSIPGDTKVILGNAVYFKGLWKLKFDKHNTEEMDFRRTDGSVVSKVPMMFAKEKFQYYEDEKLKAVRLDYTNGSLSMLLLLPNEGITVASLLADIHAAKLKDIQKSLNNKLDTLLWLPRFKLENSLKLVPTLGKLGIRDVFGARADLSNIYDSAAGGQSLHVSDVLQSAVIEVNEEGTEAAAATMIMVRMLMLSPENQIKFDRPFLYYLVDRERHTILFSGVVEDPSQK